MAFRERERVKRREEKRREEKNRRIKVCSV